MSSMRRVLELIDNTPRALWLEAAQNSTYITATIASKSVSLNPAQQQELIHFLITNMRPVEEKKP